VRDGIYPNLTAPVTADWTDVVASVLALNGSRTTPPILLYSGPAETTARANLQLRASIDQGGTWGSGKTLFAGPAGYSDMQTVLDGSASGVGIIFENGNVTFADRISFSFLSSRWLADLYS
jgi:hypothetical protein